MTFSYAVNYTTTSEGNAWWKLKEMLVAKGWTVARSGDGLSAFSNSGDVLSAGGPYPITGANSLDNTSAWMELRAPLNSATGTGDSFAFATPTVTLTDSAGLFDPAHVGKFIQIAGSTTAANNGYFLITSYISATQITYKNLSGVAEAYTGTWTIASRPRRSFLIQKTSTAGAWRIWYGTNSIEHEGIGDSFTQSGSITTLADSTATFDSGDVGKIIVISSATTSANNGNFVIRTFNSATSIAYENPAGVTEAYTGTYRILTADGFKWGKTGTGDSITAGSPCTLTDAAGTFVAGDTGQTIRIMGCTNPGNNGDFTFTRTGATTGTYTNPAAVNETSSFTWVIDTVVQSSTVRGLAADEQGLFNTPSGTTTFLPANLAGIFYVDIMVGGVAEDFSFFFGARRPTVLGHGGVLSLDVLANSNALDNDGAVVLTSNETATALGTANCPALASTTLSQTAQCSRGWFKNSITGALFVGYNVMTWGDLEGGLFKSIAAGMCSQDPDNEFQEYPCEYQPGGGSFTTERGYKGKSRLYRACNSNIGFIRTNVGRTRIAIGLLTLPWDGATAPTF